MSIDFLNVKKLREGARLPTKGSQNAAGLDLYACLDISEKVVLPGEALKVGTGIAIELPEGTFGGIYARSGLATKHGISPRNKVGIIDSDYRGELIVVLLNDSKEPFTVMNGDRIAQLIIQPYISLAPFEVKELSETARGAGGFGSTGVNS